MKVKDLITDLQKLDQDLEIWWNSGEAGECGQCTYSPFRISSVGSASGSFDVGYTMTEYNPNNLAYKIASKISDEHGLSYFRGNN
jgi:hypothetical protein